MLSIVPFTAVPSTFVCNDGVSVPPRTASAFALAPAPPVRTISAKVYPVPAVVTVMPVTAPPLIVAAAVAPTPSPFMVTVGGEVYPLPPAPVSYTHLTLPTKRIV